MSLERTLAVGCAALLVAGGASSLGLAATGGDAARSAPAVGHVTLRGTTSKAFVDATAGYLGLSVATLRHDVAAGRTLAELANETPGRSERQLVSLLVAAAAPQMQQKADMALSRGQGLGLRTMLRRRIVGFLEDTCPLALRGLEHLGGCNGMKV